MAGCGSLLAEQHGAVIGVFQSSGGRGWGQSPAAAKLKQDALAGAGFGRFASATKRLWASSDGHDPALEDALGEQGLAAAWKPPLPLKREPPRWPPRPAARSPNLPRRCGGRLPGPVRRQPAQLDQPPPRELGPAPAGPQASANKSWWVLDGACQRRGQLAFPRLERKTRIASRSELGRSDEPRTDAGSCFSSNPCRSPHLRDHLKRLAPSRWEAEERAFPVVRSTDALCGLAVPVENWTRPTPRRPLRESGTWEGVGRGKASTSTDRRRTPQRRAIRCAARLCCGPWWPSPCRIGAEQAGPLRREHLRSCDQLACVSTDWQGMENSRAIFRSAPVQDLRGEVELLARVWSAERIQGVPASQADVLGRVWPRMATVQVGPFPKGDSHDRMP